MAGGEQGSIFDEVGEPETRRALEELRESYRTIDSPRGERLTISGRAAEMLYEAMWILFGEPDFIATAHGEAKPAGSKRSFMVGKGENRRPIVVDANPNSKDWKKEVQYQMGLAMTGQKLTRHPLIAVFGFTVVRPKGHFGAQGLKPSAPQHPAVRPDLLKLARAVEDAMKGVVYGDDQQIVVELLLKRYGEPAGVTVNLWELDP
jgi:crossover junction endodeoxyribonuclease RusA